MGYVFKIYTAEAPQGEPVEQQSVDLVAEKGIVGDRYYNEQGTFSKQLEGQRKREITFVEAEMIDQFNQDQYADLPYGALRRNVITKDIKLNDLVGKVFKIGLIEFKGIELCEPCKHLAARVHTMVIPHLLGKAGLRAAICNDGTIHSGDKIEVDVS